MITTTDVAIATYVIDTSQAVESLVTGFNRSNRGRKTNSSHYRLLLVGMLLNIQSRGSSIVSDVYETLTVRMPYNLQFELGVRWWTVDESTGERFIEVIRMHDLHNAISAIRGKLNYGSSTLKSVDEDERLRRRDVIRNVSDSLLDVFNLGWAGTTYAMDATGVWSWGRGHGRKTAEAELKAAAEAKAAEEAAAAA